MEKHFQSQRGDSCLKCRRVAFHSSLLARVTPVEGKINYLLNYNGENRYLSGIKLFESKLKPSEYILISGLNVFPSFPIGLEVHVLVIPKVSMSPISSKLNAKPVFQMHLHLNCNRERELGRKRKEGQAFGPFSPECLL